jgi:chromate transporter
MSTIAAIFAGAVAGLLLFRSPDHRNSDRVELNLPKSAGVVSAAAFLFLLAALPLLAATFAIPGVEVLSAFYRSGALVFGGGHVVLPLLQNAFVARGWVTQQSFLSGYGAAQALPGPLFSFGAYLGAAVRPAPNPWLYGFLGLLGIFTPGLLAMTAVLPFWSVVRENRPVQACMRGINASVVGILIAALYQPLWVTTIHVASDFWIALSACALLTVWRIRPWLVVLGVAAVSILASET